MLMINALVSWNVMVNILPSLSLSLSLSLRPLPLFSPSPFFSLSVSQHGHSDGSLPAVSPEHLRCHSFPPTDVDRRDGWHHAVPPDRPHVLLVCQYTHTHTRMRAYCTHTHTHTHTLLHWVDPTKQCGPALIAKPVNRIHMVAWASAIIAPKKMSLWLVFSAQYETCYRILTYQINWAFTEFQATHGKCLGVRCLRWKLW